MALDPEKITASWIENVAHQDTSTRSMAPKESGLAVHEERLLTQEELKAEREYVLKLDLILLPLLSLMYFLASLDRGDIGNAAVAGMETDLHITTKQLSQCVSFFYIGYIVFQLPGDLFIRVLGPDRQLGLAMIGWGTATSILCKATTWQAIAGIRLLIGVFEAFLQAAPLYLTFWYRRDELATRGAIFFSMMAVAGSMNGVIAYGVQHNLSGVQNLKSWQWMFLIEGVLSVGMGFLVGALLPSTPEKLKWGFSEQEKQMALQRAKENFNVPHTNIRPKQLIEVIRDPKAWFYAFLYSCMNISLACFSSFLPIIIKSIGYSALETQLLTIPVYVVTGIFTILLGYYSDRSKKRGIFLIASFSIAAAGWLILILSNSGRLSFGGCFLVGMGTYPCVILIQSWMNCNIIGFTKRAGSLAFIMVFGQSFGILGAELFDDAPKYYRGKGLSFGAMTVAALVTVIFLFYLKRMNDQKRRNQDSDEAAELRTRGVEDVCDNHPDFMYWY